LIDFLIDLKVGAIGIDDVRQGKRKKIIQQLKALRAKEKREAVLQRLILASSLLLMFGGIFFLYFVFLLLRVLVRELSSIGVIFW
jgi:hypothetical protein